MQTTVGARFAVRNVSPTRMVRLFMSRHAPQLAVSRGVHAASAASSSAGADASPPPPPTVEGELRRWVEAAGGSAAGVSIQRGADGYGLVAAADCAPGSTLVTLPQRCHLTYDGSSDPRLLALIERVPAELWGAKLALAVVQHRLLGAASPYAPYIAALPLGVQGLPMFFDGEALGALQYPPVTEQVKKRCRWLLSFARDVLAPVSGGEGDPFQGSDVDANALGWALAVVTSRAFRTRGPGQPAAMLPLIDMANHSFQPNAKIAPGPGGSMHMVALRQLQAGEPVVISYGQLANDFLLLDYGFIVPGNPHDTVQLRWDRGLIEAAKAVAGVGSAGDDGSGAPPPLAPWQQRELAALGLEGPGANTEVTLRRAAHAAAPADGDSGSSGGGGGKVAAPAGQVVDPRLLAGVRVLCAPNPSALGGRSGAELGQWDAALAAPVAELAALRTLTGLCAIALSQFTGSLEDDDALLSAQQQPGGAQQAQQQLSEESQLAVRFRMDKKRLLLDALGAISDRIKEVAPAAAAAAGGPAAPAGGKAAGGGKGKVPASKSGGKGFAKQ